MDEDLMTQIRAEVSDFVRAITEAAENNNANFIAESTETFSAFFAQAVIDGMRAGRMESTTYSVN